MAKRLPDDIGEVKAPRTPTQAAEPQVSKRELAARAKARLRKVPVFKLAPHPVQPIDRHADENVSELAASIKSLGLQEPPLVWLKPDRTYVILAGHRRVRAWQLLASAGDVEQKIRVFVLSGLADGDDIAIIAAEYAHRQDFSPLHAAQVVGAAVEHRRQILGREPTVREMADLVPWGRSQIGSYNNVYRALQDPCLGPLVRRLDKPSISLLDKVLGLDDFRRVEAALEAYGSDGPAGVKEFLPKKGRPKKPVRVTEQKGGYDLLIRFRDGMTPEAAELALAELRKTEEQLRVISERVAGRRDGEAVA